MPATVGYQPTLPSEVAELEDRIVSSRLGNITSVQAVYVPADDMTDPAVSAILAHLDTRVILSRAQAAKGIYPAVDPLASGSKLMDRALLGDRHYTVAHDVREHLARYHELEDIITMLGHRGAVRGGPAGGAARAQAAALPDPAFPRDDHAKCCPGRFRAAGADPCRLRGVPARRLRRRARGALLHARRAWRPRNDRRSRCTCLPPTATSASTAVTSFVGEDASGSFGLLPRHDRFMTVLTFGLARLLLADG